MNKRACISSTPFAQILRQARQHDEESLVLLYQRSLPVIYRYVLARLGRMDLVEDVVSEVFLVMVESISELRTEEEAGFYAWLIQIAQGKVSRALRQHVRTRTRQVTLPDPGTLQRSSTIATEARSLVTSDVASDPVALQEWRETLLEIGEALGKLSEEHQMIVIGRFLAGQSIEELAQALGKTPGTIRVSQYRALQALARHLGRARGSQIRPRGEPE